MQGWPSGAGTNSTIAATTAGVAGGDTPALGVIFHLPAAAGGGVTITMAAAGSNAGGIGLAVGETTQILPCPGGNLNGWKAWSAASTITLNATVLT